MSNMLSISRDNNIMAKPVVTVEDIEGYKIDQEKIIKRLDQIEKNNKRRNWIYSSRYKRKR